MTTSTSPRDTAVARDDRDRRTVEILALATATRGSARQAALDTAVEMNLEMARRLASQYFRRGTPNEDLEQVACLALVKAVRGFDAAKSDCFVAFAIPTIRGELRRHFRDSGWMVRPPRRIQELSALIRGAEAGLEQQLNRAPTTEELAKAAGVEASDVREVAGLSTCYTPASIDAPVSLEGHQTLGELITTHDTWTLAAEARLMLAPLIAALPERDRQIIGLRFVEQLTQREIGNQLGISQMQISRILTSIYARLRDAMGDVPMSPAA